MSKITELQEKISCKTLNFVLLTIVTVGIYPLMWLYRNHRVIDDVTGKKSIDDSFVIWIAICIGVSSELEYFWATIVTDSLARTDEKFGLLVMTVDITAMILTIAGYTLYIICAFKLRSSIQEYVLQKHKIDLSMNRFHTFLFGIFYINYCINDLEEVERKKNILQGKS